MSNLRIAVIHGPNLNLLGSREPDHYGSTTLAEIDAGLQGYAAKNDLTLSIAQHNSEGALIDAIQAARNLDGIVINPAGYTHTSVAIRDALLAVALPTVEIHLSNPHTREAFRHHSTIADIVFARVMGLGASGYELALRGLADHLRRNS